MVNPIQLSKENEIIKKYNQACDDYNVAKNMSDEGKAGLAAVRIIQTIAALLGIKATE